MKCQEAARAAHVRGQSKARHARRVGLGLPARSPVMSSPDRVGSANRRRVLARMSCSPSTHEHSTRHSSRRLVTRPCRNTQRQSCDGWLEGMLFEWNVAAQWPTAYAR